jgi:hypothetical protein
VDNLFTHPVATMGQQCITSRTIEQRTILPMEKLDVVQAMTLAYFFYLHIIVDCCLVSSLLPALGVANEEPMDSYRCYSWARLDGAVSSLEHLARCAGGATHPFNSICFWQ